MCVCVCARAQHIYVCVYACVCMNYIRTYIFKSKPFSCVFDPGSFTVF